MSQAKPRPRRRWLRRLALLVGLLVVAVLVLPGVLADGVVRGEVEELLSASLGTDVTVSGLSLGWWSPVEANTVVIKERDGDGTLLEVGTLNVDAGIWSLLFGRDVVRITLRDVELSLRELADGRLNVLAFVESLSSEGDGSGGDGVDLPERGAELRIESSTVRLGDATLYGIDVGVSCDALDRDPLRFKIELARAAGGRIDIGGSLAGWNVPGATPSVTGTVEAQQVDLSTLAAVLGPTANLEPHGVVRRLVAASEPRKGGRRLVIEADVADFFVAPRGEEPGKPLESVRIRLSGALDGRSIKRLRGTIVVPQGRVELDEESHLAWDDSGFEGRVKVHGEVDDLESVEDALAGLLPAGLDVTGGATVKGHVAGHWARDADTPWTQRLEGIDAAFDVTVTGVDYDGISARDITARGTVADGELKIERASTSIGGGEVFISGSLAVAETADGSNIEWTIIPAVTLEHAFEGAGKVLAGFGGSGTVSMERGGIRLLGDVTLEALSAPDFPGMPLHLGKGSLRFDARVDPDHGTVDIDRVHLKVPNLDVRVDRMRISPEGDASKASGSVTATVRPAFIHRLVSEVRFVDAVTVSGTVVALLDDVWPTCDLDLDVAAGELAYAGHDVARIVAHIDKAGDAVAVSSFECDVGGGTVTGGGSLHADGLRAGDEVELVIKDVSFAEPLADGAWRVAGELSGTVTARGERGASTAVFDLRVKDPELRGRPEVGASMKALSLSGKVGRAADGTLRLDTVRAMGDGVAATIKRFTKPPPDTAAPMSIVATVDADAAWISALLDPWLPEDLELEESLHLDVAGTTMADAPVDAVDATITLRVPSAKLVRRSVKDLVLVAVVRKGRATVTEGRARIDDGRVTLGGTFALASTRRTPRDKLTLVAERLPLTIDQDLEPTAGNARRVSTTGIVSGTVTVTADVRRALRFNADIDARSLARHLVVGSAAPHTKTLPDLKVVARGSWADVGSRVVRIERLIVAGEGVACGLTDLVNAPDRIELKRASASLPVAVVQAFTLGADPDPTFRPTGAVAGFIENFSASYDSDGEFIPERFTGNGHVAVGSCIVAGLAGRELGCTFVMRDGAVELRQGQMRLSGGTVKVLAGTRLGFVGSTHSFRLRAEMKGVQLGQGVRTRLSVLNPLLFARPETDDVTLDGTLDLDLDCGGTWSTAKGWSKTVNGSGHIVFTGVNVRGSALLLDLASHGDRLLGGTAAKTIFAVLGEQGPIGKVLRPLCTEGFTLQDLEAKLDVKQGRMQLAQGFEVASPDLVLTVTGWGSLEGDVNYRVDTDVVARLKQRALKKLSKKNNIIGQILGVVNVLGGIGDMELGADVVGNVFDGTPKIDVNLHRSSGK